MFESYLSYIPWGVSMNACFCWDVLYYFKSFEFVNRIHSHLSKSYLYDDESWTIVAEVCTDEHRIFVDLNNICLQSILFIQSPKFEHIVPNVY